MVGYVLRTALFSTWTILAGCLIILLTVLFQEILGQIAFLVAESVEGKPYFYGETYRKVQSL